MGYETHIILGSLREPMNELELDMENPFDDGSGYPYKKDEKGNYINTGRQEQYIMSYAEVNLCKIYDSHLDKLIQKFRKAQGKNPDTFIYRYHSDGDTRWTEDNYGDPLVSIPFDLVLNAVRKDVEENDYRRYRWLLGLMEAMKEDHSEISCVFYGS
jgi:hypothetical protein